MEHKLPVGSPMLERSKGRGQTNLDHLFSRLRAWDRANNPWSAKNKSKQQQKTHNKSVTGTSTTKPREPDLGVEGPSSRGSLRHCRESLMAAARPTPPPPPLPLLTSKTTTKITTWGIHTMYEAGKAAQVAAEMNSYKVSLLGLCDSSWTQSGQMRPSAGDEEEDAPPPPSLKTPPPPPPLAEGIALMLTNEEQPALISWEAVSSRIDTAKFRTKMKKSTSR